MREGKIDIIRQPIPTLLATFALLVVMLTIRFATSPHPAELSADYLSPLGEWLNSLMGRGASISFTIFTTIVSGIIITRIISRYSISVIRSFVPMVLYIIGVGGVVYAAANPALQLCWLMLLRSAELHIACFKRYEMFDGVMCAAVYIATAVLLVPELVWLVPLLVVEWFLFRRSAREMVAAIVAMAAPVAICTFAWWFEGHDLWLFGRGWLDTFDGIEIVNFAELYSSIGGIIPTILLGLYTLVSLLSIATFATNYHSMRLRARKIHTWFTLLWFMGVVMIAVGTPLAVAIPIMNLGAIPLIHTFLVKHAGIFSATCYLALTVATLLTTLL